MARILKFLVLLGLCHPSLVLGDWITDVDAGLLHDSNLNNAELDSDISSDSAMALSASVGQFIQIDSNYSVTVTGDLRTEGYKRFTGMNNVSVGVTASLRRKLDLGAAAPWARLSVSAARLEYNEDLRDGWLYTAGLAAGQRVAERWDLQMAYSFERRRCDEGDRVLSFIPGSVYDLKSHNLSFDAGYSFSEKTLLFGGYKWRDGDVVSTSEPNFKIFRATTALAADPTFGPGMYAYTLDAKTHIVTLGISQAINEHASLNFSYQRQMTHGDADNNYYKNVFSAFYLYGF